LNNLDWLGVGGNFPPVSEMERLEKYEKNRDLFNGEHRRAYAEIYKKIKKNLYNFEWFFDSPTVLNYQRVITLKMADLICGECPQLMALKNENGEIIMNLANKISLQKVLYEIVIDISRFGNSVIKVFLNSDGLPSVTVIPPSYWFCVTDDYDKKIIKKHVIAYVHKYSENRDFAELLVEIHEKGFYSLRTYEYNVKDKKIGHLVYEENEIPTGLDDFSIINFTNITTSDSVYGYDDYMPVNSLVSNISERIAQINRILDKHAQPTMTGPASALEKDERSGKWFLPLGNFFKRQSAEDPPLEYVTWHSELENAFKFIEILLNQLFILSEMGTAVFDSGSLLSGASRVESGVAMRLKMTSPLIKSRRIISQIDLDVKKMLSLLAKLDGFDISVNEIGIIWKDGLPNDDKLNAEIVNIRTGGKPTMSQIEAIMALDGKNFVQASESFRQIKADEREISEEPVISEEINPVNIDKNIISS